MSQKIRGIANVGKFLILLAVLSAFAASPLIRTARAQNPEDVVFYVDPATSTGRYYTTVDVRVHNAFYIYSWQVYIAWDSAVLSFYDLSYGGYLADQPEGSYTSQSIKTNYALIGESMLGSYMGKTSDGLLVSITFQVETQGTTTLTIDHSLTYYNYVITPPTQTKVPNFHKENGNHVSAWLEDINADGIIDIFDISLIGLDWGACTIQTNNPSTTSGKWASGSNAYTSDDTYASCSTKDFEQTYSGYGFVTTTWTSVTKVEVGLERKTDSGGDDKVTIAVSNDGGSSWSTTTITVTVEELTDTFTWYDFTTAYTWTPSDVAGIAVKLKYSKAGGTATPICVDWLPVRVTPEPQAISPDTDLNGDGIVDITDLSMVAVKFGEIYAA